MLDRLFLGSQEMLKDYIWGNASIFDILRSQYEIRYRLRVDKIDESGENVYEVRDIQHPAAIKGYSKKELQELSQDIRDFLVQQLSVTGGHL